MSETIDRPLSHWIAVARMGFERDFHRIFTDLGIERAELARRVETSAPYVSKILNAEHGNFQLKTMCKLARAIGAIVQVRLVKEGEEVVRVLDYDTAASLDDSKTAAASVEEPEVFAEVVQLSDWRKALQRVDNRAMGAGDGSVFQGGASG